MTISTVVALITLIQVFIIVSRVFAVLYIVFSCRYYHESVSAGLCILAVFFPLIAVIVQLSRKKHFQGAGMNVCRQCGEKVPPTYEVCPRCLVPLEPYDERASEKSQSLSHIMLAVFSVCKAVTVVISVVFFAVYFGTVLSAMSQTIDSQQRIPVMVDGEQIYYDKMGVFYTDPDAVALYAKDGTKYVYDEESGCFIGQNHDEIPAVFCVVDGDGWLYYDEEDALTYGDPENDALAALNEGNLMSMTIDELIAQFLGGAGGDIWYDEDGNVYYGAFWASWNEKGELLNTVPAANP